MGFISIYSCVSSSDESISVPFSTSEISPFSSNTTSSSSRSTLVTAAIESFQVIDNEDCSYTLEWTVSNEVIESSYDVKINYENV